MNKEKSPNAWVDNIPAGMFFTAIIFFLWPPILALIIFFVLLYCVRTLYLLIMIKKHWSHNGKTLLFVYSNSPVWQEYIENNVLPKIESKAVILNWSERSKWDRKPRSLEAKVFRHWAGSREYNPIAMIFNPGRKIEILRFWQAFRDHKHGKEKPLKEMESKLFELVCK